MEKKERQYRVVTFLKRDELDYLDDLAKDMYFKYGINIPRTKLIEEIIDAFKEEGSEKKDNFINKLKEETK